METYPRLVIAGLRGGSGKTTVSLGLIAALRSQKGLTIVPFKKGPDYIDAGWMSVAAKRPCYNLDPFLIPKEDLLDSFRLHATGDIAVIEGNRGLYDGMDAEGSYSTAELAKLLDAPVVLVVDVTKMTRTTAALVLGCMHFDRAVKIRGVVLNQVSGGRHESVIRASIEQYCSLPVFGAIPRMKSGDFPERHMGLTPYQEHPDTVQAISFAEEVAGKYLDMDGILEAARSVEPLVLEGEKRVLAHGEKGGSHLSLGEASCHSVNVLPPVRIGVVRDSAFQFYYPENFEALEDCGAELVETSALTASHLPDIDALYIGGGFPETHAIALAENTEFRDSLKNAVNEGLPVYAECGGLMYLGDGLLLDSKAYPMAGIFPLVFSLERKPQAHGYSIAEVVNENPFYAKGTVLRGHEFHYSKPLYGADDRAGVTYAFRMKRGHGMRDTMDGICFKNVLATYTHLHALGAREWVEGMIRQAAAHRRARSAKQNA
ncbi:MAG TPA: cobyrinate a,c-diamide synthase [Thermodesulfovibrionales bacterium]|nr:cobyrinate a,c-diamide synthase [Thermodesulfovibrionales bacterium]